MGSYQKRTSRHFLAKSLEETRTSASGRTSRLRHWDRRLLTQPGDRELMTRHETQARCPEILITNYSMLEYMLMRPIERPIFQQTRDWLRADPANEFILVLDEATCIVALAVRKSRCCFADCYRAWTCRETESDSFSQVPASAADDEATVLLLNSGAI